MLRCVMFDMDGTIADTLPLCIAAFRRSIEAVTSQSLTDRQIIDTFGPSEEGTIAALAPAHFDEGLQLYLRHYEELHHEMCPGPFEGIADLFRWIKSNGLRLALVTGKGTKSLQITLRIFGMDGCFDVIEAGRPEGPRKPEGMRSVLEELALRPREAVYIGDVASDILAARKVAVPVVAAAWAGTCDVDDLRAHAPDCICYSVPEAKAYLQTLL